MKPLAIAVAILGLYTSSLVFAQEPPMFPEPQKEHEFLKKFVGEWETAGEAVAGPNQPAMKCEGKIQSKMLGGFWVVSEMEFSMMGLNIKAIQTVGYDDKSKKYVGTWVDSMSDHLWKYEGTVDETGKILTLEAEGPNFIQPGKTAKFRDIYEFKSEDLVATTSMMEVEGKWITFMTGTAKRKK